MLGIEEKDPVITGKYADDLYEEYKSVYGNRIPAVREDLRETGIGETIIQWIDDKARTEHPHCKFLSVNALVDPDYGYTAVPFYEKCHFIPRKSHAMAVAVRMTRIIK